MFDILKTIDPNALVEEVRSIAAKHPGHIYQDKDTDNPNTSCFYQREGKPSCIMGHALFNLGVPIATLQAMDTHTGGIYEFLTLGFTTPLASHETLMWLNSVQNLQDNLKPWGYAVGSADTEYPGV
jgi:hypothetical protein